MSYENNKFLQLHICWLSLIMNFGFAPPCASCVSQCYFLVPKCQNATRSIVRCGNDWHRSAYTNTLFYAQVYVMWCTLESKRICSCVILCAPQRIWSTAQILIKWSVVDGTLWVQTDAKRSSFIRVFGREASVIPEGECIAVKGTHREEPHFAQLNLEKKKKSNQKD